jgi:hypothetical protein
MNATQSTIILLSSICDTVILKTNNETAKKKKKKPLRDGPVYRAIFTQNTVEVHIPRRNRTIEHLLDM